MNGRDINVKWIIATCITLLVVAAIVTVLIRLYAYLNAPFTSPYAAMPANTAIVVHLDSSFSPMASSLPVDENIEKEYNLKFKPLLEKVYCKHHYNKYITNSKICIIPYQHRCNFLWIAMVNKDRQKLLEQKIAHENLSCIHYKDMTIYKDTNLYFYLYNNILVASHHAATLRRSVNRLGSDTTSAIQPAQNHKDMCISYIPANMKPLSWSGSLISNLDTSLFRQINTYYTRHKMVYTGNADITTAQKCTRKGYRADIESYYEYIPSIASQVLILQENAYQWLQDYDDLSIEQHQWMQYFQPLSIVYMSITAADKQKYHYILLKPKHAEQLAGDMFFLTEKNESDQGGSATYDTFLLNNVEVGRVNIPNFAYLRWHIASGLSYMKDYIIMDDYILLAGNDNAIQVYLNALQHTIHDNADYAKSETYFTSQADMMYFNISSGGVYRLQMEQHDATSCFMHVYSVEK